MAVKLTPIEGIPQMNVLTPVTFAGENSETGDLKALKDAKRMAENGANPRQIWRDTGWFKGLDGGWRYEIDDSDAKLENGKFSHPKLEEAYPNLFSAWTFEERSREEDPVLAVEGMMGYMDRDKRLIAVAKDLPEETKLSTFVHEFQHAVQEKEEFSAGGNPNSLEVFKIRKYAQLDQGQLDRIREARKVMGNWSGWWPDLKKEKQVESFLKDAESLGVDVSAAQESFQDFLENRSSVVMPILHHSYDRVIDVLEQVRNLTKPPAGPVEERRQFETYELLGGEAEARTTEARRTLTQDQRRASFPFDWYDVPTGEVVRQESFRSLAREEGSF